VPVLYLLEIEPKDDEIFMTLGSLAFSRLGKKCLIARNGPYKRRLSQLTVQKGPSVCPIHLSLLGDHLPRPSHGIFPPLDRWTAQPMALGEEEDLEEYVRLCRFEHYRASINYRPR
jgi:hypothetical protein